MAWALLGAVLIGLSLGLLGSGGSILTVPVLTYLVGQEDKVAIAGSLAIVGTISAVAALPHGRRGRIDARSVVFFGLPGMAGAWLGAYLAAFVPGSVQLSLFAVLMLVAAFFMARPVQLRDDPDRKPRAPWRLGSEGLVVGAVTGFVGVGGGFLIVPALVLLGGLSMHRAVGTSLVIIALKSFTGVVKYLDVLDDLGLALDWQVIGTFSVVGILGSFAGNALVARLPQRALRLAFAGFLVLIGAFVVVRAVPELFPDAASEAVAGAELPARST